jgi:hypothetical protein
MNISMFIWDVLMIYPITTSNMVGSLPPLRLVEISDPAKALIDRGFPQVTLGGGIHHVANLEALDGLVLRQVMKILMGNSWENPPWMEALMRESSMNGGCSIACLRSE